MIFSEIVGDLLIVPRPRHLEFGAVGSGPPLDTPIREQQVGGLPTEGYELEINTDGVTIRHGDDHGLRYGRSTLDQIRTQAARAGRLPTLHIRDWPDFPARVFLLDISRNRVPTRETLARLVEIMAIARINQFELYTEHTFAYRDHEVVWRDASPMTPAEIHWLDELCRANGIELVPNQNTFGHMNRWLAHDEYRHRAEAPDGFELLPGMPLPSSTLAPTLDNADFVLGLLDELLPNFTSRKIDIDADEPFELGAGVSKDAVAALGKPYVYAEHVNRIARPLVDRGYEVRYFCDVIRHEPNAVNVLPPEAIGVAWVYEAMRPESELPDIPSDLDGLLRKTGIHPLDLISFEKYLSGLDEVTFPLWVAPGTSSWNSLIGRVDNAVDNLIDAAAAGAQHGATGYVITDWGDNGHLQPPSISFGPMIYGGAVSWCLDTNRDLDRDLPTVLDRLVFDDASATLGATIDRLGRLWRDTGQQVFNCTPFHAALFPTQMNLVTGEPDAGKVMAIVEELDSLAAAIGSATPKCGDGTVVRRELALAARLARHGAMRMVRRAGGTVPSNVDLKADLEEATQEQEEVWLARSRPGGLDLSLTQLHFSAAEYSQ